MNIKIIINNLKGFTLVEVLLALAILGIGLVGISSVFVVGANSVRQTIELTEASFIAQIALEDFKRQGHSDPSALALPEIPSHYKGYSYASVNPTPVSGVSNLYRIDLAVNKNNKLIKTFTTYITKL